MTKAVTISIPHELGKAEARRRIEQGFGRIEQQFGAGSGRFDKQWEGDRLSFAMHFMGQGVTGSLDVLDAAVRMEIHLPDLLAMVAGKLKGRLKKEGQLLLEKK
jgi:putative polyhydroxyalkanoate system protein